MKTLSLLLGAALLVAPALAHAEDASPAPVVAAPAPMYFVPSWAPAAYAPSAPGYSAPTRSRNVGLLISGIALAGLGTASLVGGAVMLGDASRGPGPCSGDPCFSALGNDVERSEGTFFAVNGGLMMVSGVAMAIAGGWQVPVRAGGSGSLLSAPSVAVGPGNATFKWSF